MNSSLSPYLEGTKLAEQTISKVLKKNQETAITSGDAEAYWDGFNDWLADYINNGGTPNEPQSTS